MRAKNTGNTLQKRSLVFLIAAVVVTHQIIVFNDGNLFSFNIGAGEVSVKNKTLSSSEDGIEDTGTTRTKPKPDMKSLEAIWQERELSPTKRTQIENYRRGKALILNINPIHHAGTSFCERIGRSGIHGDIAPSVVCMHDGQQVMPDPPDCAAVSKDPSIKQGKQKRNHNIESDSPFCYPYREIMSNGHEIPWHKNQTGPFIEVIRPYFHMISWEFWGPESVQTFGRTLDDPDWDHPSLVSVVITRDPLSRLLASDIKVSRSYPGYRTNQLSRKKWWNYAVYENEAATDNFFLRILTATNRPPRTRKQRQIENHVKTRQITNETNRTTQEIMDLFPTGINETHFEHGKSLLEKFTFVLDIACLDEGMEALGRLLGLERPPDGRKRKKAFADKPVLTAIPRERIAYNDVYEYLVAKNEWDIALYNYSKTISLVQCDESNSFWK